MKNTFYVAESKNDNIVVENIDFQNLHVEDDFKDFIVIVFDRVSIIFEKISIKRGKKYVYTLRLLI